MQGNPKTNRASVIAVAAMTLLLLAVAGCHDSSPGSDAISSQKGGGSTVGVTTLSCTSCHASGGAFAPASPGNTVLAGGTGAVGKHQTHVEDRGFSCESCHSDYFWADTHMDGQMDGGNTAVSIVRFDETNQNGVWSAQNGSCASVACHGGVETSWNTTETLTCTSCHASGSTIDPVAMEALFTDGKHQKHVADRGISCQGCHLDYNLSPTHVDGKLDSGDPAIATVLFDANNPSAYWDGSVGSCGTTYCHGATDGLTTAPNTPNWFAANSLTCTSCHSPGSFTYPVTRDQQGIYGGEHKEHVEGKNIHCAICHQDYSLAATHVNFQFDGAQLSTLITFDPLVSADPSNPDAIWFNDTGPGTGTCGAICHWSGAFEIHDKPAGSFSRNWYK